MQNHTLDERPEFAVATASPNINTFLAFIDNLVNYVTDKDAYTNIIHPEAVFFEYPNLINKSGQVRDGSKASAGVAVGKTILAKQQYSFTEFTEAGDKLVAEGTWTGTMAIDAGHLVKGQELKAYLCIVIDFKDGKIYRQRNYDCYLPFG